MKSQEMKLSDLSPNFFHQLSPKSLMEFRFLFDVLSKEDLIPDKDESTLK